MSAPINDSQSERRYRRSGAAAHLGVSLRTLDRLIAIKELAVKRVGKMVFIRGDTMTDFRKHDHKTCGTPGSAK
jgi:hypothetical protein